MGEQMLSREYYYLGTQLPMDRFLTFYYGHPGYHINNILVILSVQLFMFAMVFIGRLGCVWSTSPYSTRISRRHAQRPTPNLQVQLGRCVYRWSRWLLQLGARLRLDQTVHHFHLYVSLTFFYAMGWMIVTVFQSSVFFHCVLALVPSRVDRTWSHSSRHSTWQNTFYPYRPFLKSLPPKFPPIRF